LRAALERVRFRRFAQFSKRRLARERLECVRFSAAFSDEAIKQIQKGNVEHRTLNSALRTNRMNLSLDKCAGLTFFGSFNAHVSYWQESAER